MKQLFYLFVSFIVLTISACTSKPTVNERLGEEVDSTELVQDTMKTDTVVKK